MQSFLVTLTNVLQCFAVWCTAGLMAPKIRGGHKQKRQRLQELEVSDLEDHLAQPKDSALGTALLIKWAHGQLTATDVQELSYLAVKDGVQHPEILWLSGMGSTGSSSGGNCSRALYRKYLKGMSLPEPFFVKVKLLDSKDKEKLKDIDVPILLPHEWFGSLQLYPGFKSIFGFDEVQSWWEKHKMSNPKFWQHPMLDFNYKELAVPLALHGDGAQYHDRDQLYSISMKPLLFVEGETIVNHFLLTSLPKSISTKEAWDRIWHVLGWSFEALLLNKHPAQDPFGNSWESSSSRKGLAGKAIHSEGYFGVCWGISGDLDFFNKDLGTPAMSASSFCWRCKCDRANKPWNDFRPSAEWRKTLLTSAELNKLQLHCPLFGYAGITPAMIHLDFMHTLDLGVTEHVIANILWTIIYQDMPGRGKEAMKKNFNEVWLMIQEAYKVQQLSHRLTSFSLQCITDVDSPNGDYPSLKRVKAAECRHLLKALEPVVEKYTTASTLHQHRFGLYVALKQIYDEVESSNRFLNDPHGFASHVQKFQLHYQFLARKAMEQGQKQWSVVNKFHFLEHVLDQAKFENPTVFWAYSGEDYVGKISRLAHMCAFGKPSHEMLVSLFGRYRIGLHLAFTRLG